MKEFNTIGTINKTNQFVPDAGNKCTDLVLKKLKAYKEAAWLIAANQVTEKYKDGLRDFEDRTSSGQEHVEKIQTAEVTQSNRIQEKWPTFTPKVIQVPGGGNGQQ